ncbi:MAG: hypothetical protein U0575_02750 [Phycisphaerales bacterium]
MTLKAILATDPAAVEPARRRRHLDGLANAESTALCRHHAEAEQGDVGAVLYVEYFADEAAAIDEPLSGACWIAAGRARPSRRTPTRPRHRVKRAGELLLHGVPGAQADHVRG